MAFIDITVRLDTSGDWPEGALSGACELFTSEVLASGLDRGLFIDLLERHARDLKAEFLREHPAR